MLLTNANIPDKKWPSTERYSEYQRLTHWKLFLAFAFPGFFLSTTLESLVRKPADQDSTKYLLS